MQLANKDVLLGGIYAAFGLIYGITALRELPIGAPLNMGPGFFPVILSGGLLAIGIVVAGKGLLRPTLSLAGDTIAWRGLIAISLSTVVFALTVQGAGMVIATVLATLVASVASRRARLVPTLLTALILAAFCTLVFVYGLRLPIGLMGSWFG